MIAVFVVSKNTGPSYYSDPVHVIYIGQSLDDAIKSVGDFARYEKKPTQEHLPSALPDSTPREQVAWYEADGWWASIERLMFDE